MHPRPRRRTAVVAIALALLPISLAACGGDGLPDTTPNAPAARTLAQVAQELESVGDAARADRRANGFIGLVRRADETRLVATGVANTAVDEAMTPHHRFMVGSVTKLMVATVVLQLVQDGRISLTDPVQSRLPGLLPDGDRITVEMLLSHRSGLASYTNVPGFDLKRRWKPEALVALATAAGLEFAPDERHAYSNTNYLVLGLLVEKVTGNPIEQELSRRIFRPAKMTHTSIGDVPDTTPPFAHGYLGDEDVTLPQTTAAWAAGGVVSTVGDVGRFLRALLRGRYLEQATLQDMLTSRSPDEQQPHGLGPVVTPLRCGTAIGHNGLIPGYATAAWALKDGSRVAVLMVNDSREPSPAYEAVEAALC